MLIPTPLTKLATALGVALALTAAPLTGIAGDKDKRPITYVDPATGEVKETNKLLSEMSEAEKAQLTNDEIKALEELELNLKKKAEKPKY